MSRQSCTLTFCLRAWKVDSWIVAPSAKGSLKGIPSSIASAPAATSNGINSRVVTRSG